MKELQKVMVYPIGTRVFYFVPTWNAEPEIKESVVLGAFVHKSRGELHYNLVNEAVEAYAVRDTREGIEEQHKKFMEVREKLLAAHEEHKAREKELWGYQIYPDYSVDNLTEEGLYNGDSE